MTGTTTDETTLETTDRTAVHRPGLASTVVLGLAGMFYSVFAALYFADLLGLIGG